ncbi:MAG: ABC transporter permease [Candidatus Rokubacteria bacterium]|nr:ABC transporter permease [Candidatus Rokubacteria bacterium]
MSYVGYALRRVGLMVLVVFGVTLITFFLTHVVPVNPVIAYVGDHAPPSVAAAVARQMGLTRPLPVQYGVYVWNLLHGNLGISIANQQPVGYDIGLYLPATVELSTAAILVVIVLGLSTGILSALWRNTWVDQVVRVFALSGVSLPVFFTALVFLAIFYVQLGWLPGPGQLGPYTMPPPRITGMVVVDSALSGDWPAFWDALSHLVLPAVVLGWSSAGVVSRMVRSSLLEVMGADYIRTARAKGLSGAAVVLRHALRNALIPTVTVIGLSYGSLLQGAVLTETIFAWPGIGRFATLSVTEVDVPAVLGVTLVAALIYSFVNLIVDLLYAALDPRISYA